MLTLCDSSLDAPRVQLPLLLTAVSTLVFIADSYSKIALESQPAWASPTTVYLMSEETGPGWCCNCRRLGCDGWAYGVGADVLAVDEYGL